MFIEHVNKTLNYTPSDVKWIPMSPRFVTTGTHPKGTGAIQVWEMVPGEGIRSMGEIVRPEGVKCGTFGASFIEDRHFATGDFKGNLAIVNLSRARASGSEDMSGEVVWRAPSAHTHVNCIDACGGLGIGGGAPEIATGGREGAVKLWDPRISDPVMTIEPAAGETGRECWCVAFGNSFSDDERCLSAGYDNGDVKLFDLRTQSIRWETNVGNGGAFFVCLLRRKL